MKVLVTGGAGYVGAVLIPHLLECGHQVVVLDSLRYGGNTLLPFFHNDAFEFIKGDVADQEAVAAAVQRVDGVVHLAAIVGFPACLKYPDEAERTNVEGTRVVASACRDDQVLVYASTGSNYGALDSVCTEESPLNPVSHYAITKTEAETIALEQGDAVALRFATAFGVSARMRLDLLINDFVHQAVVNKQLIVYEGGFRRTFVHVRDMARAIEFALTNYDRMRGQNFNVGHESLNLTKEDIARKIREIIPYYLHFAEIGSDPDVRDYEVSYQRIRELGYETSVTIEKGILELVRVMEVIDVTNPWKNV